MKTNHDALLISSQSTSNDQPAAAALSELCNALERRGFDIRTADDAKSGLRLIEQSPRYGLILLYWDADAASEIPELAAKIRERSAKVPIYLLGENSLSDGIPYAVLNAVTEYVHLYSETPNFTANRMYTSTWRYANELLPPYFQTLKNFTQDGEYYWDCPGHMGGMAYLKHPVGVEFIKFFGENIMRADIGVATAEMGDYLVHAGPSKKSEDIAAELFGADWTFYGVAGSSGSNRIVAQGAIGANELAIVDRNCHKSLNHGLTLSQGRPVYLIPSRNGYGLIGPIPAHRLRKASIEKLIADSPLAAGAVHPEPTWAVVTNCTYDGFCYNVTDVVTHLAETVPRIHFDEAWYAYAKFHPIYEQRFAMDVPDDMPNRPTIFAVQSTHKMLPAMSMASMIHVKRSDRAPLDYDDFNESFMMHGTTSPFYPIIASIDVAVGMMQGEAGRSLVQESIDEAIAFRKAMVRVKNDILQSDARAPWFFGVLQPDTVTDPETGDTHDFVDAPVHLLGHSANVWRLNVGDEWHGFADDDVRDTDSILDPVKVTITCPGITARGHYEDRGIPGYIVTKFLDDRRIEIARTGDYTLLILFSVGITKGKWGTLVESLLEFKRLYDGGAPAVHAIPSLATISPIYATMTLKQLCDEMHGTMRDLDFMKLGSAAVETVPTPVMSPAEAYQKVVRYKTEQVKLSDFSGRIAATMLTPYPPGIPVLMPGERLPDDDSGIMAYLEALQTFDKKYPGFEHEIQGVSIDQNGEHWVRAIIEDNRAPRELPDHIKLRKHANTAIKKGRA